MGPRKPGRLANRGIGGHRWVWEATGSGRWEQPARGPVESLAGATPNTTLRAESSLHTVPSRFTVRSYELDSFGHLNHAVFLNFFEQARFDALEACGWPIQRVLDRGWAVYVVRIEVDYLAEVMWGEELSIKTGVDEVRKTSMTMVQTAEKRDGTVAARARVIGVWVGENRRPMRMPEELRAGLSRLMEA
jgi:acyl-CoA thioester hydrolase